MFRVLGPTKIAMLVTDIGFLLYWAIAFAQVIPPEWAYRDSTDPILSDWNYSFVVLDLAASATGLASLARTPGRHTLMTVSLTLTSVAGLQALAFWTLRGDFSPLWWAPNLFLLLFPLPALVTLVCDGPQEQAAS
jgi:hypothetical protein